MVHKRKRSTISMDEITLPTNPQEIDEYEKEMKKRGEYIERPEW